MSHSDNGSSPHGGPGTHGNGGHGNGGHGDHHDFTGPLSPPVRRFLNVFLALCGLLLVLDLFGIKQEEKLHVGAEGWFGFYPLYGFVGCVTLVLVAKQMRRVVMRSEDYYEPVAHVDVPADAEADRISDADAADTGRHGPEGREDSDGHR